MAEVVVFHHVQGLTDGGVHSPRSYAPTAHRAHADLFERATGTIDEGIAHSRSIGTRCSMSALIGGPTARASTPSPPRCTRRLAQKRARRALSVLHTITRGSAIR